MSREHPSVLYIEDQPEMVDLVRLTLRRLGCEVVGATDGREGLALMRKLRPDVVLLDLMLPGSDGWEIRAAMLADEALRQTPVILVTARAPGVAPVGGRPLPPADACVTKPFSLGEIRSLVQTVLQQHAASYLS
ncbi:MAG: response regulator [Chloroflexi bacterium]|nr:response regulator [Chloroflexota bacterium]